MAIQKLTEKLLSHTSAQVWMLGKLGKKRKDILRLLKNQGPTRSCDQSERGGKLSVEINLSASKPLQTHRKKCWWSIWELFPAALRALLRVKTAVRSPTWRPKGHVPALCGFVTATATELLATFQINLHMRYQGVTERITGEESGDLVLVQVPQMTSYDLEQVTTLLWASISLSKKQVWHWIKGTEKKSLTFGAGYLPCFGDPLGIWNTLTHLVNSVQEYEWSIL